MARHSSHLRAYLTRHGEPDALHAAAQVTGQYQRALVVPCFDEPANLLDTLLPADARGLLVILVINIPDNAGLNAAERTRTLLESFASGAADRILDAGRNVGLLIIDRASRPIPKNQGVGLARKIGTDCAAALWLAGRLQQSWIYCTDADVELPMGYFDVPMPNRGGAIFPFRHYAPTADLQHKADIYELHLRYYKNRLEWSGSPYAFHTLGSTLAIHPEDYAIVRGYPRRNAGEDFYLLNKLAKVSPIHRLAGPTLRIQARISDRTPFGTGAALKKMQDPAAYVSYSQNSFRLLRRVLSALDDASGKHDLQVEPNALQILDELGFARFFADATRQYTKPGTLRKAMNDWFDGFRTLRFIHECRRHYPDTPLLESLAQLFPDLAGRPASVQAQELLCLEAQSPEVTSAMATTSHLRQKSSPGHSLRP